MKVLKIIVLAFSPFLCFAQNNLGFNLEDISTQKGILGLSDYAVMIGESKYPLIGIATTNFYAQTDCNAIKGLVIFPSNKAAWKFQTGLLSNRSLQQYTTSIAWCQRLATNVELGTSFHLARDQFPELIQYHFEWEVSAKVKWDRHQLMLWMRAPGSETYDEKVSAGGFYWRYRLGDQLIIQSGLRMRSNAGSRWFVGLVQKTKRQGEWFGWLAPMPMTIGTGWSRCNGHWSWGIAIVWSAMPLPSFQQVLVHEKN
jgi:hypothetical protein